MGNAAACGRVLPALQMSIVKAVVGLWRFRQWGSVGATHVTATHDDECDTAAAGKARLGEAYLSTVRVRTLRLTKSRKLRHVNRNASRSARSR